MRWFGVIADVNAGTVTVRRFGETPGMIKSRAMREGVPIIVADEMRGVTEASVYVRGADTTHALERAMPLLNMSIAEERSNCD